MVRGKKHHTLSEAELSGLKEEKRELEGTLRAVEGEEYGKGTRGESIDRAKLKATAERLEQKIREGSPEKLSGTTKDKMADRARELERQFTEGMPTRDEMERPTKNPGAVQKNLQWERANLNKVLEWKQIQRNLNAGDPTASNIEKLRRAK